MDTQTIKHLLNEIGARHQENMLLKKLTTFRIGGPCPLVIFCALESQLEEIVAIFHNHNLNFRVIGGGSNLLISDAGIPHPIIQFSTEKIDVECINKRIIASAATQLDNVVQTAAEKGLKGINFASGIPGTVGGAVIGNAGAFGFQIGDCVEQAEILTPEGSIKTLTRTELKFSYRNSILKYSRNILLSVILDLKQDDPSALIQERNEILNLRRQRHPDYHVIPCAGSFFKNIIQPNGMRQAAGWFLDRAGCKGLTVGEAAVFEKHANIIINRGQATAHDIMALSSDMKRRVKDMFGIELEPEVRILGMDD